MKVGQERKDKSLYNLLVLKISLEAELALKFVRSWGEVSGMPKSTME